MLQVSQVDPNTGGDANDYTANQVDSAEASLAGSYFPWNGYDTVDTLGYYTGIQADTNDVWYFNQAVDFNGIDSPGEFTYDNMMLGVPGVTGSPNYVAAALKGYLSFPTAGYYVMSVNSDDGFRVSEGLEP